MERNGIAVWTWGKHLGWLKILVIALLVFGLVFRFVNLDQKIYWHDETLTSLRVFGSTQTELVQQAFAGDVITVADLQRYQTLQPETGWEATLTALQGNPEHPPLYYLLARLWAEQFGSSVTAMRSLPAVISLLALPCMYWLCLELFGSTLAAWLGVAMVAVSPFHVLYAQEAREYSLWIMLTLLSSALLLWALRWPGWSRWGLYAIATTLSLYTHILASLVVLGHGLYILWRPRKQSLWRRPRSTHWSSLRAYGAAATASGLAFIPWLLVMLPNLPKVWQTTASVRQPMELTDLLGKWFLNLNRVFLDVELASGNILMVLLIAYVCYWLCRHTPPQVWLFVITLAGATALPLALPDLFLGGRRSGILRYLLPCYIAVQLAVAYYLAAQLTSRRQQGYRIGRTAIACIAVAGVLSALISAPAQVWWTKSVLRSRDYPAIAHAINQAGSSLVLSDSSYAIGILSLSRFLDPNIALQLFPADQVPLVATGYDHIFLLNDSWLLHRQLEQQQGVTIRLVHLTNDTVPSLWRLQPGLPTDTGPAPPSDVLPPSG